MDDEKVNPIWIDIEEVDFFDSGEIEIKIRMVVRDRDNKTKYAILDTGESVECAEGDSIPVFFRHRITKDLLDKLGFANNKFRVDVTHFKQVFEEEHIEPQTKK